MESSNKSPSRRTHTQRSKGRACVHGEWGRSRSPDYTSTSRNRLSGPANPWGVTKNSLNPMYGINACNSRHSAVESILVPELLRVVTARSCLIFGNGRIALMHTYVRLRVCQRIQKNWPLLPVKRKAKAGAPTRAGHLSCASLSPPDPLPPSCPRSSLTPIRSSRQPYEKERGGWSGFLTTKMTAGTVLPLLCHFL